MYTPPAFREDRLDVLHSVIRALSFGTLVSHRDGEILATPLPFLLAAERGPYGTLVGHLARANPQSRHLDGGEMMVLFQGPHAYVSPLWYATKPGVPTWNYVAIHAYGCARLVDDEATVKADMEAMARAYEGTYDQPWSLQSVPEDYVANLMAGLVGFEIPISRLEGKRKLSQNRSLVDRRGVIAGLRDQADPLGLAVADLMAALDD